ncbi:unnamed protein product [Didymodactylos carnosus]|nr:unnamed protein product [Didymodactylos carnosus]CAF4446971.1 unnamed protein product [Didymodactylos carnosus]
MTIETEYTKQRRPFTIYWENTYSAFIPHIYRVVNEIETEITSEDDKIVQHSDSKYQVILKLQGPEKLTFYGAFLNYEVAPSK